MSNPFDFINKIYSIQFKRGEAVGLFGESGVGGVGGRGGLIFSDIELLNSSTLYEIPFNCTVY